MTANEGVKTSDEGTVVWVLDTDAASSYGHGPFWRKGGLTYRVDV